MKRIIEYTFPPNSSLHQTNRNLA